MMNQHYGFSGRTGRLGFDRGYDRGIDRTPYRRPINRNGMTDRGLYPYGDRVSPRIGNGCGCGSGQGNAQPFSRNNHAHGQHDHDHAIPTMTQNGGNCGCGNGDRRGSSCSVCGEHHQDGHTCNGSDAACKRLMDQIRAVDFALYETVLYLDVYPNSCDALETYHKLKEQSRALHKEYEASCSPLTAFGNESTTSWDWMGKPFPWEYDAD